MNGVVFRTELEIAFRNMLTVKKKAGARPAKNASEIHHSDLKSSLVFQSEVPTPLTVNDIVFDTENRQYVKINEVETCDVLRVRKYATYAN